MNPAIVSLLILLGIVVLMLIDKIPTTTLALSGAVLCCLLGMYNFADILTGIGTTTAVLILSLTIIGTALFRSGLAQKMAASALKLTGRSERGIIIGILVVSILLSAISSNTAVVLMMIPMVKCLSQEANISLKRTMFPLAIGAGLGGGCTLIGGTSNVSGNQVLADAGLPTMGFWDLGFVGIPVAILSVVFLLTIGTRFMPRAESYEGEAADTSVLNVETNRKRMIITAVITILSIAAMMISTSALFAIGLIGALLLILTGCVSEKDAFASVDVKLLILISSFGVISQSISNTGGDQLIADWFLNTVGGNASPLLVCAFLFLITAVMTQFLSNVVAIVMMGPIAITIATALSVSPVAMVMTVIIAGNACYATPFGSPYLTMLMPIAKYKFIDYVKMGLPYVLITFLVSIVAIPLIWPF